MMTDNYRYKYKKGFCFKRAWESKIEFFEVVSFDKDSDMIHLKAYPKEGEPYDTEMFFLDYEDYFFNGKFIPLEQI